MKKPITIPCSHMILDSDGYILCELMPSEKTFCVCELYFDICNPTIMTEASFDSKGKISLISPFNFPDSKEMKEIRERTKSEADVPKLCPKGFTYEQIEAKAEPLIQKFLHSKKHIQDMKKLAEYFADWQKEKVKANE